MAISETRRLLNKKYRWLVREGISKCLGKHGFSHKGNYYWRDCDSTVAFAIAVTKLTQWDPNATDFRISCGMVAHVVPDIYEKLKPNWVPNALVGQIAVDPDQLTSRVRSHFSFTSAASDDDLAALAQTITQILEDVVLPWYAKFKTARDVGDYILSPGDEPGKSWLEHREIKHHPNALRKAAIAYFGAGEFDRALGLLDLAKKINEPGGPDRTNDLRERMERLIAQRRKAGVKA